MKLRVFGSQLISKQKSQDLGCRQVDPLGGKVRPCIEQTRIAAGPLPSRVCATSGSISPRANSKTTIFFERRIRRECRIWWRGSMTWSHTRRFGYSYLLEGKSHREAARFFELSQDANPRMCCYAAPRVICTPSYSRSPGEGLALTVGTRSETLTSPYPEYSRRLISALANRSS